MSIQAVAWALDNSGSRGFARLVLISLANHANDTDLCWPSMRTIAREAGISVGSVPAQVKRLIELGEIEVVTAGNARTSTRYRVLWRNRPPGEPSIAPEEPGPEPDPEDASASVQEVNAGVQPGVNAARGPGLDRTITNHQGTIAPPEASPPRKPRARTPRDDLFDALVAAFGPASTPARSAFYGRTVTELLAAEATPAQVQAARIEMSRRGWNKPTPEALVKHWDSLLNDTQRAQPTNPAATRFWEQ